MSSAAKSLDDYLADPFNQGILQELEDIGLRPLEFFEAFYHFVSLVEQGRPSQVIQELDSDGCQGGARLYILHLIQERLRDRIGRIAGWAVDDAHEAALFVIDKECSKVEQLYPPDMFPSDPDNSIDDRARRAIAIRLMTNDVLGNMLKKSITEAEHQRERDAAIELRARQEERERLEREMSKVAQEVLKAVKQPRHNPEFTTNRQVIALCYLLKAAGVSANSSEQARFIEFLTNKTPKEIYKRVLAINDTVFTLDGKDAIYVRDWFHKLGLTDLAKKIDEILDRPSEKL